MGGDLVNPEIPKRWVRRNKGAGHPTNIMAVSAIPWENHSNQQRGRSSLHFRTGYAHAFRLEQGQRSRKVVKAFRSHRGFWGLVADRCQKKKPLWIFAYDLPHVFSLFDGWNAWQRGEIGIKPEEIDYLPGCEPKHPEKKRPGFFCENDPPVIICVYHRSGAKIVFCDVRNYYNLSLEEISAGIGAYPATENVCDLPIVRADAEAVRQCGVVADSMVELITRHKEGDLGNWGHTSAAIGWNAYRHRFMKKSICMHGVEDIDSLERDSYFGGRTEVTRVGKITDGVWQLDVNALYPSIMAQHSFPCELVAASHFGHEHDGDLWKNPIDYIADVRICSPRSTYPVRRQNVGTILACGRFSTTLAGPELRRAMKAGHVIDHGRWAKYRRANLFGDAMRHFWKERLKARDKGDFMGDILAKSCSNSLYGRFARHGNYWEPLSDLACWNPNWKILSPEEQIRWLQITGHELGSEILLAGPSWPMERMIRRVGRHWQVKCKERSHPNSFTAISAFVTAWGREFMRVLIDKVNAQNVYRIATDSVLVNMQGYCNAHEHGLIDPRVMGLLKVEREAEDGDVWSVHHWRIGDYVCHGSVSYDASESPDGSYVEKQVQRMHSLMKTGWKRSIDVRTVRKNPPILKLNGAMDNNGRLQPLHLKEF